MLRRFQTDNFHMLSYEIKKVRQGAAADCISSFFGSSLFSMKDWKEEYGYEYETRRCEKCCHYRPC